MGTVTTINHDVNYIQIIHEKAKQTNHLLGEKLKHEPYSCHVKQS